MRDSIINKIKTNKLYIIPAVHFLLSFAYEHFVLFFDKGDFSPLAVVKSNIIGDMGERVMGYIISKLFAGIIIFLFWSLVFYVMKNIRKNRILITFSAVFTAFLPVIFLLFPDSFIRSIDNLLTYSYAIRFYPEYWHSAYTGIVYCACLMVFPHPFSIAFLQWLFFIFVIGYIFTGAVRVFPEKKLFRWLLVLFFCIPGLFILITDPYRTELYALVCTFYIAFLMFELIERKPCSTVKTILFILLSAFVGVWRTEGVILGVLGFVTYMINLRSGIKKTAVYSGCFVLCFVLVFLPQKLGDSKYYSSDYTIINSFASLQNILNRSDSDLDYPGAQEDLESIEKIVPTDLVKQFGLDGYRRYNYKNSHPDINQSTVSHEEGKAYVRSYYNILLHNPRIYLQTQMGMLKKVLDITSSEYVQYTEITLEEEYPKWSFPAWDNGLEDYLSYPGLKEYYYSPGRSSFAKKVSAAYEGFRSFLRKTHFSTAVYLIISGMLVIICVIEAVLSLRAKDKKIRTSHIACFVLSAAIAAEALAVILVMPAALSPYFHPYIFGAVALEVLYPYFLLNGKKNSSRF